MSELSSPYAVRLPVEIAEKLEKLGTSKTYFLRDVITAALLNPEIQVLAEKNIELKQQNKILIEENKTLLNTLKKVKELVI